jgi:hypothetical protein
MQHDAQQTDGGKRSHRQCICPHRAHVDPGQFPNQQLDVGRRIVVAQARPTTLSTPSTSPYDFEFFVAFDFMAPSWLRRAFGSGIGS